MSVLMLIFNIFHIFSRLLYLNLPPMNATAIIFSLVLLLIFFRIFMLKARANRLDNPHFRALPKEAALAVLKDCLLSAPTETNLQNLVTFAGELGQDIDPAPYRLFIEEQLRLSSKPNALAEDNELFAKEATFLDTITPPELIVAQKAKEQGNTQEFIERSLEAVTRFYSDEKIEETLEQLLPEFPKAKEMLQGYRELKEARELSLADEESLKILRAKRDAWENTLHL